MELSNKYIILIIAIILTGLSAGFFYAWEVSVIQGTKRITAQSYVEAMQSINRAIINPAFLLIFFGPLLVQVIATYQARGTQAFWFILAATLAYLFGTFLVTSLGNVPLNNALDALVMNDLSSDELIKNRNNYERSWNRLHTIRTVFAVMSFILLLIPFLFEKQ